MDSGLNHSGHTGNVGLDAPRERPKGIIGLSVAVSTSDTVWFHSLLVYVTAGMVPLTDPLLPGYAELERAPCPKVPGSNLAGWRHPLPAFA